MKKILLCLILLSGCAMFDSNKTPLTPQGMVNACIRDEIITRRNHGVMMNSASWNTAINIAETCTKKHNVPEMYNQAVTNARNMMGGNANGTSLQRW